jgi:hypothetical protein
MSVRVLYKILKDTAFLVSNPTYRRSQWPRGLRPLYCWDCGFESHRGHGCLSVVSVVCCQVGGLCVCLITRPEESYRLFYIIVCDLENLVNEEALAH